MPSNKTHRPIGRAGAAVTCTLLGLPIGWWLVPIAAATYASPWPDHLERVPRAVWRRVHDRWEQPERPRRDRASRLLRKLQVHRRWTHWLSVGFAIALLLGAAAAGALVGAAALLLLALEGIAPDRAITMPGELWTFAAWVGVFAALGIFVGYALHSYFDGWTELGSPMGGPWCKRRLHVVPKIVARRRARRGKEPWLDDDDEEAIRRWAPRIIVASVALHYRRELWLAGVWIYDVVRPALT
jgi:hypothetical protein